MEALCDDELDGRKAGSDGERLAARYLYDALAEAGVLMLTDSLGQDFTITGDGGEIRSRISWASSKGPIRSCATSMSWWAPGTTIWERTP